MIILIISPKNKTVFNFRGDLIKDMIQQNHQVFVVGPNKDYLEDILELGITRFVEIPLIKDNTSIWGDLRYLVKLTKVIKHIKPDMVLGYTAKPVIYGSIASKLNSVGNVYGMVTGLGRVYATAGIKTKIVHCLMDFLYKLAFFCCKKAIFQNQDDVNEMIDNGCLNPDKAEIVNGSGVNMNRFKRMPLPPKTVFLMVSRIIREKGILEYCEAARSVKKKHPEIRCVVLGGFDSSIGALKLSDIQPYIDDGSIELPGEVKDPVSYYGQCSVFVLPSYYREGLPRTILEAMSCGRPVITTDWIGCKEPIKDGENGYLVPIKDSDALIDKMNLLIEHPDLLVKLADSAYYTCKQHYEVSIVNQQMRRIMQY